MSSLLNINHFINFLIVFLLTGCVIKRQVVIEIPDSHMFWIQNSKTEPSKIQRATLFWTNDAVLFTFNHHKLSFRSLTAIIRIISANLKKYSTWSGSSERASHIYSWFDYHDKNGFFSPPPRNLRNLACPEVRFRTNGAKDTQ